MTIAAIISGGIGGTLAVEKAYNINAADSHRHRHKLNGRGKCTISHRHNRCPQSGRRELQFHN